jgi:hypothetical protein
MKKVLLGFLTLIALTASSMSFAWGGHRDWDRGGWNYHTRGFGYGPALIAGAAVGMAGAYAYHNFARPYYAPPRVYYVQPSPYYQQPYYVPQQPIVVPQQAYPYRPPYEND